MKLQIILYIVDKVSIVWHSDTSYPPAYIILYKECYKNNYVAINKMIYKYTFYILVLTFFIRKI